MYIYILFFNFSICSFLYYLNFVIGKFCSQKHTGFNVLQQQHLSSNIAELYLSQHHLRRMTQVRDNIETQNLAIFKR